MSMLQAESVLHVRLFKISFIYIDKERNFLKRAFGNDAPINVKPKRGGGGAGNSREFDCDAYPQGAWWGF